MTKMAGSTNSLSEDIYCSERNGSLSYASCRCSSLLASSSFTLKSLSFVYGEVNLVQARAAPDNSALPAWDCRSTSAGDKGPHLSETTGLAGTVHGEPPLAHRRVLVEEGSLWAQERELLVLTAHVVHLRGTKGECLGQMKGAASWRRGRYFLVL